MSQRQRLTLAVVGLILVVASLVILAYVFWPLAHIREPQPLVPTLFVPPQSLVDWLRFA